MLKQKASLTKARTNDRWSTLLSCSILIFGFVACDIAGAQSKAKEPAFSAPEGSVPAPFKTWDELYTEQERLNTVANAIDDARSHEGDDGFAGMIVDPALHDVRVYWKGSPPASVAKAIAAGRTQVPVQVLSAPYSEFELLVEAERWVDSKLIVEVAPKPDGKGLRIGVAGPQSAGAPTLPGGASIPYDTTYGVVVKPVVAPYWRHNDHEAYYGGGGALIRGFYAGMGYSYCSLGFAITDFEGYPGFLTAAHCGQGKFFSDVKEVNGTHIGWFYRDPTWVQYDIAFISGYVETGPRMFTGGAYSGTSRGVAYGSQVFPGSWVATSGSRTGEHTGIKVTATNVTISSNDGFKYGQTSGSHFAKLCVVTHGDSGGPVFSFVGGNDGRVIANGIITTMAIEIPAPKCQAYDYYGGSTPISASGAHTIYFVPIGQALQQTGATLRTSLYP